MQGYEILGGVAQRKRRHSGFYLNALVVIEINEIINEFSGLLERLDLSGDRYTLS